MLFQRKNKHCFTCAWATQKHKNNTNIEASLIAQKPRCPCIGFCARTWGWPWKRLNYHPQRLTPPHFHGATQAGAPGGGSLGVSAVKITIKDWRQKEGNWMSKETERYMFHILRKEDKDRLLVCNFGTIQGRAVAGSNVGMVHVSELLVGNSGQGWFLQRGEEQCTSNRKGQG